MGEGKPCKASERMSDGPEPPRRTPSATAAACAAAWIPDGKVVPGEVAVLAIPYSHRS